jgi:hypothetical protein
MSKTEPVGYFEGIVYESIDEEKSDLDSVSDYNAEQSEPEAEEEEEHSTKYSFIKQVSLKQNKKKKKLPIKNLNEESYLSD